MKRHKMDMITHTKEYAEWLCPECGRRLRVIFAEDSLRILNPGDQNAIHTGTTTGGLEMGEMSVEQPGVH